ncbi:MAG: 50S ribosomal protein L19 [Candidatus Eisenbacteria sp.]|nr:50S ribosomal protein L19 [Candidatus Eisenbacteria bacterium]
MDVIRNIEAPYLKQGIPDFMPGDTVKISVRVVEGDKVRQQAFHGVVLARDGTGISETFTVRKISDGIAIERIFPLHSPNVQAIEVVRRGKVRRAKLSFMRSRKGKSARIKEKKQQKPSSRAAKGSTKA